MYKTLLLETQTTAQTENLEWMYRVAKFCNKKHNHIYKSSMCGSIFSHLPSLSLMNKFEAVFFKWRCHHRLISYSTGKYVIMQTKITIPPSVFTKQFNISSVIKINRVFVVLVYDLFSSHWVWRAAYVRTTTNSGPRLFVCKTLHNGNKTFSSSFFWIS